jgi:hypothetical protein
MLCITADSKLQAGDQMVFRAREGADKRDYPTLWILRSGREVVTFSFSFVHGELLCSTHNAKSILELLAGVAGFGIRMEQASEAGRCYRAVVVPHGS